MSDITAVANREEEVDKTSDVAIGVSSESSGRIVDSEKSGKTVENMVNADDSVVTNCDKDATATDNCISTQGEKGSEGKKTTSEKEQISENQQQTSNQCNMTDLENLAADCERLNLKPVEESSGSSTAVETRSGIKMLRSWLNKNIKVEISDGRFLVGVFLCTDRDSNVIIGLCNEYTRDPDLRIPQPHSTLSAPKNPGAQSHDPAGSADSSGNVVLGAAADAGGGVSCGSADPATLSFQEEGRILGLAMVPGRHIKKLYIDDSPLVPASSRANTDTSSEGSCHST